MWPAWHRRNSSVGRGRRRHHGATAAVGRCRRAGCRALALCRGLGGQATHTLPWSWRSSPPPQLVAVLRGGQLVRGRSLQACITACRRIGVTAGTAASWQARRRHGCHGGIRDIIPYIGFVLDRRAIAPQ